MNICSNFSDPTKVFLAKGYSQMKILIGIQIS